MHAVETEKKRGRLADKKETFQISSIWEDSWENYRLFLVCGYFNEEKIFVLVN